MMVQWQSHVGGCTSQTCKQTHQRIHTKHRRKTRLKVHALSGGAPPVDYNWRLSTSQVTRNTVKQRFPELLPLVDQGTLIAWPRPDSYQERRDDNYVEPRLILLVGTAHVSQQSAQDVARVINIAKPDCVVVELCRSRSAVMAEPSASSVQEAKITQGSSVQGTTSNVGMLSLTGGDKGFMSAFQRSAALGGQSGLVLRLLLASLARKASNVLGVAGGGEFLAARRAAESVGAQIVLGDRPVEITLQRAWASLGVRQRIRLVWDLLQAVGNTNSKVINADLVEQLKQDDTLSALLGAFSRSYPELLPPLVYERDAYLAWSLKRSKAVNGADVVVGVIGAGHTRGVTYALKTDNGGDLLRFSDLVGGMNQKATRQQQAVKAASKLLFELGLGTAAYFAWLQWAA